MNINLRLTKEHIEPEMINSPSIGHVVNILFNLLRTSHAIANTDYIYEETTTNVREIQHDDFSTQNVAIIVPLPLLPSISPPSPMIPKKKSC